MVVDQWPTRAQVDDVVARLNDLTGDDPEVEHGLADDYLFSLMPHRVQWAYREAQSRARGWWYA